LGTQLARALGYAHKQGVVHRDFKPSNVLLTMAGTPKITDFGLAKLMGSTSQTQSGTILGSAPYMSPEQAAGKPADERSDVYALGITLYEMTTGRTPFEGDTASLLVQHITQTPPPPHELCAEIPLGLETLILSMLAKDPDKRTRDLEAVARQLAVMANGLGHEVAPVV
jgi:serine/threonine-protein kinase